MEEKCSFCAWVSLVEGPPPHIPKAGISRLPLSARNPSDHRVPRSLVAHFSSFISGERPSLPPYLSFVLPLFLRGAGNPVVSRSSLFKSKLEGLFPRGRCFPPPPLPRVPENILFFLLPSRSVPLDKKRRNLSFPLSLFEQRPLRIASRTVFVPSFLLARLRLFSQNIKKLPRRHRSF